MAHRAAPLHIGPADLRAAWAAGRRSSWPASFEATQCHPLYRRLLRCEAVRRALAQQRAQRNAANAQPLPTPTPIDEPTAMHLAAPAPARPGTLPADNARQPVFHGAMGSDARLAVLYYLAHRPAGATKETLAHTIGLDPEATLRVLTAMRRDHRVACDRTGGQPMWYVPAARAAAPAWVQAQREAREAQLQAEARGLTTRSHRAVRA